MESHNKIQGGINMYVGGVGGGYSPSVYNIRRVGNKPIANDKAKPKAETQKTKVSAPHVEAKIDQLAKSFKSIGLYNDQGAKVVAKSIVAGNLDVVA